MNSYSICVRETAVVGSCFHHLHRHKHWLHLQQLEKNMLLKKKTKKIYSEHLSDLKHVANFIYKIKNKKQNHKLLPRK